MNEMSAADIAAVTRNNGYGNDGFGSADGNPADDQRRRQYRVHHRPENRHLQI